jgi:hypothetical protein
MNIFTTILTERSSNYPRIRPKIKACHWFWMQKVNWKWGISILDGTLQIPQISQDSEAQHIKTSRTHQQLMLIANIRNLLEHYVECYCGLNKSALYFQDSTHYIMERFSKYIQCRLQNIYPEIKKNNPVLLRHDICVCPLLTVDATSPFTCIQKAASSNISQNTKYPHSGILWFSSVPAGKFQDSILN